MPTVISTSVRFRRAARCHHRAHRALAHRHRRQPRPVRRFALPGQATTGLVPPRPSTARSTAREPPTQRDRAAQAAYFQPYHAALAGNRAVQRKRIREWCSTTAIPSVRSSRGCFRRAAGHEYRHQFGRAVIRRSPQRVARSAPQPLDPVNGRFKGGWITRSYGRPATAFTPSRWSSRSAVISPTRRPPRWDPDFAAPIQQTLRSVLEACIGFAS